MVLGGGAVSYERVTPVIKKKNAQASPGKGGIPMISSTLSCSTGSEGMCPDSRPARVIKKKKRDARATYGTFVNSV